MYMCGEAWDGNCNVDIKDNFQELSFFFHSRFGDLSQVSRHLQHILFKCRYSSLFYAGIVRSSASMVKLPAVVHVALVPHFPSLTSTNSASFIEEKP